MKPAARIGALFALLILSTSTFAAPPVKFGVQVDLTGNGSVTSSPGGISCPTSCLAYFKQAATITLTAVPAAGETFLGWGGACSGTGSCTIPSIQGDVQVAAQFSSNGGGGGGMTMVPEGTEPNSLLYWNGAAWAELLPPASASGNFILKLSDGVLVWHEECVSGLQVGDEGPAGGTVFYVDASGCGGLEAAPGYPADYTPWGLDWGCNAQFVGGTSTEFGSGARNTEIVAIACGPGSAAGIAASYAHNGYEDWFLGSRDELQILVERRALLSGWTDCLHWSSSEYDNSQAHGDFDPNTQQSQRRKDSWVNECMAVRPIRKF